ncbi:MAG: hypothetical protein ACE5IR_27440 [bacterium]
MQRHFQKLFDFISAFHRAVTKIQDVFVLLFAILVNRINGKQLGFFPVSVKTLALLPVFLASFFRSACSGTLTVNGDDDTFTGKSISPGKRAIFEIVVLLPKI